MCLQYTCPQRKVYMALGFCWTLVTVSTRMSNPTTLQFGAKTWVSSLPAYWGRSTSHKCPLFKMVPSPFKAFWLDSFYLWLYLFKLQNTELQNLTVNSNNSNFNMEGGGKGSWLPTSLIAGQHMFHFVKVWRHGCHIVSLFPPKMANDFNLTLLVFTPAHRWPYRTI